MGVLFTKIFVINARRYPCIDAADTDAEMVNLIRCYGLDSICPPESKTLFLWGTFPAGQVRARIVNIVPHTGEKSVKLFVNIVT